MYNAPRKDKTPSLLIPIVTFKTLFILMVNFLLCAGICWLPTTAKGFTSIIARVQHTRENANQPAAMLLFQSSSSKNDEVESLKEQARRLRLEAELMDQKLTQSKIDALELQVERYSAATADEKNSTVAAKLRDDIVNLRLRLEGKPPRVAQPTTNQSNDEAPARRQLLTVTKPGVRISKLTPEQLQQNVEIFLRLPGVVQAVIRKTCGIDNMDAIGATELIARIHERDSRLLSDPDRCNESKNFFFRFFGSKDVKDQLENLYQRSMHYKQLFPEVVRRACRKQLRKQDVEYFRQNVLNTKTFTETSEPEIVPGGCYIIRGLNRMENAGTLIDAIDEDLESSRVAGSLQFFYIDDLDYEPNLGVANDTSDDDLSEEVKKEPVLLITGPDLTPPRYVRNFALTSLAFATTGFFSASVWVGNGEMEERIQNLNLAGQAYQDKIVDSNIGGVFVSMCFLFLVHDLAHKFVASQRNVSQGSPPFSLFVGVINPTFIRWVI